MRPGTKVNKREYERPPPLLEITDELASAAALLAELEAVSMSMSNGSVPQVRKRASGFWMEDIERMGSSPWGDNPRFKVCSRNFHHRLSLAHRLHQICRF